MGTDWAAKAEGSNDWLTVAALLNIPGAEGCKPTTLAARESLQKPPSKIKLSMQHRILGILWFGVCSIASLVLVGMIFVFLSDPDVPHPDHYYEYFRVPGTYAVVLPCLIWLAGAVAGFRFLFYGTLGARRFITFIAVIFVISAIAQIIYLGFLPVVSAIVGIFGVVSIALLFAPLSK